MARERDIPFLGLCLGLHMAVIEFARNVCHLKDANSTEINPETPHPVIDILPEQKKVSEKGGTMRLGAYPCELAEGSLANRIYGVNHIDERHRHRYEVNNSYRERLSAKRMVFSGLSPNGRLVEMIELKNHPWFIGCQFHPEFKSRPMRPHPLFRDFVAAALRCDENHRRVQEGKLK